MIRLFLAALALACLLSPADAKSRPAHTSCIPTSDVMRPCAYQPDFLAGVRSIRVTMKRVSTTHKANKTGHKSRVLASESITHRDTFRGGLTFQPSSMTDLVSRARAYMGTNPTGWRSVWCGRFMAMIAPAAAAKVHNPNVAKAWLVLQHTSGSVGDIAVLARRGGGHVGVVTGFDGAGNPIIVSGNHGRRVGEGVYAKGRVLAFVSPG